MTKREKQRPTERPNSHGHDEVIREHPAFGAVVVTRPQGQTRSMELFGSRVPASSYISITIHEAQEHRRLQSSHHHPGRIVAKVAMTEAQFATMVGSVGLGSGVPCTIEYRHTEGFAQIPGIEDFSLGEDRARHIREMTERQIADLKAAVAKIDALLAGSGSVSKTALREARDHLTRAVDHAASDYGFAAGMVSEHLAESMAEIKQELHAYSLATGAAGPALPGPVQADRQLAAVAEQVKRDDLLWRARNEIKDLWPATRDGNPLIAEIDAELGETGCSDDD